MFAKPCEMSLEKVTVVHGSVLTRAKPGLNAKCLFGGITIMPFGLYM